MNENSESDVENIRINKNLEENENIKLIYSERVNICEVVSSTCDTIDSKLFQNPKNDVEMISDDDVFQDANETNMTEMTDEIDSNPYHQVANSNSIINRLVALKNAKDNKPNIKNTPDRPETEIYYNMLNQKRGIAVILNHVNVKGHSSRNGTEKDLESLKQALTKLSFDVQDYTDLSKSSIISLLETIAKENHEHHDCLMIIVMSHGEPNYIYASDDKYPSEFLWSPFLGTKCESLIGKPKLFFLQACRGEKVDDGAIMSRMQKGINTQTDSPESDKPINFFIPAMADLLMMYSTYEGHYSFRSPVQGSWFIQALCEELNEHGETLDLLTLLTGVNRRIAFERRSNIPDKQALDAKKQMPCITSTLTKTLYFTPKSYKKP